MSTSCDPDSGACGLPTTPTATAAAPAKATLLYVTDPICSGCWAFEPTWRKLRHHYDDLVSVRNVYGGLLPDWEGFRDPGAGISAPADVAGHWLEVAERTGQPIDPSVWLADPPVSSYPASKAAHIVRMLAPDAEERFLRRVREAVFVEARNIARRDVLVACATDAGVDAQAFSVLFDADAGAAGLTSDLRERGRLAVRHFPTVMISTPAAPRLLLLSAGAQHFSAVERALRETLGLTGERPMTPPTARGALQSYRTGTTLEFATLLDLPEAKAEAQLAGAGAARRGPLWVTP